MFTPYATAKNEQEIVVAFATLANSSTPVILIGLVCEICRRFYNSTRNSSGDEIAKRDLMI